MKLDHLCQQIYIISINEANLQQHEFITPEHILNSIIFFDAGKNIISAAGGNIVGITRDLQIYFDNKIPKSEKDPVETEQFSQILDHAGTNAKKRSNTSIQIDDILLAMINFKNSFSAFILSKNGLSKTMLIKNMSDLGDADNSSEQGYSRDEDLEFLKTYAIDLTEKAYNGELDPMIGRQAVVKRTLQVLTRRRKNNPIHVGDPGVGKTTIVEGLAISIANGDAPERLKNAKIYHVDMASVLAGTKYRGDFEERFKNILEIMQKEENIIVYLDEIHTLVGAGSVSGSAMDASNILKPYLTSGKLRFIGSTTYEEYKKHFEKDGALSRRFQKIEIAETSIAETIEVINGIIDRYELFHNVEFSEETIEKAVILSNKYIKDRFLPDKAIDIIDETASLVRLESQSDKKIKIKESDIVRTISQTAKIPLDVISDNEMHKLQNLESDLNSVVFGQKEANKIIVEGIKRSKSGVNEGEKPIASYLFVGPTGVGKTEISKQLALLLDIPLHRFDMSEYQEKHAVSRLIGAPPGYVGYEEGGILTDIIRKTPHCVLLLDEIEKAHIDLLNILLQVMDYAVLTDNFGKKADFRNVIIIMTSNAGAREIGKNIIGFDRSAVSESAIAKEVDRLFSPEFRNRLDKIVLFNALNEQIAYQVAEKNMNKFSEILSSKDIKLAVSEDLIRYIANKGYSAEYGAREITRVIDQDVKTLFVDLMLFGKLKNGGFAKLEMNNDEIKLTTRSKPKPRTKAKENLETKVQ